MENEYGQTEMCPHCGAECFYPAHNPKKDGYIVACRECGHMMFLCDACRHADETGDKEVPCNWHIEGNASVCNRGMYIIEENEEEVS